MRLLFASDSFKGTLSSAQTAELLRRAAKEVFGQGVCCTGVPVADGGEGTAQAVALARGGRFLSQTVHNPRGKLIEAQFCALSETEAIFEMAEACGLSLLAPQERDPLITSSFGAGELLCAALDHGFRKITVAIGGSATNDGGMGFSRALGVRFFDAAGQELEGCGEDLEKVNSIDISGLDARLSETDLTVLCDVKNPLCGENGATRVFAPQKGADAGAVERLERGMEHYRAVITRQFGIDPNDLTGSGAAGGLGTALQIFFGAKMRSGIEAVLDLIGFDALLSECDLVVTGEGRCDAQSVCGKVMQGVGERAKRAGKPAIGICGCLGEGYEAIYEHGIDSIVTLVDAPMSEQEAFARAEELYLKAAVRAFRMIAAGEKIKTPRETRGVSFKK